MAKETEAGNYKDVVAREKLHPVRFKRVLHHKTFGVNQGADGGDYTEEHGYAQQSVTRKKFWPRKLTPDTIWRL